MGLKPPPGNELSLVALAHLIHSSDPSIVQFLDLAVAESQRLKDAVRVAETRCLEAEADSFLDAGHRGRLEDLVLAQDADIRRLTAVIARVQALLELAEWSARTAQVTGEVTILAGDLAAALSQTA